MVDIGDFLALFSAIDSIPRKHREKKKEVCKAIVDHCLEVIDGPPDHRDKRVYLHQKSKSLYNHISTFSAGCFDQAEFRTVIGALSAARVYYWARFVRENPEEFRDETDTFGGNLRKPRSHSLRTFIRTFIRDHGGDIDSLDAHLDFEETCLADIAELEALYLKL